MAFLAEIKRRRVGKVAVAYGAVAWAVTESASVVLPALGVPEWAMSFLVVFLLVGFPIAMVLAWVFDVSPTGIQRTEPLPDAVNPPQMQFRTRAAFGVAVLLAMAGLGYLLYERGLGRAEASGKHGSIAVLPFTNLSGDASKDYFSDGMSEELLNLLARVPGLQVAARTSAFAFKGRNVDIREVGKELGVETVLEGSVRQSGDQVRITAQLIDTETGFHLWSETYDRKLQDIFAVQDEIAQAIVEKLKIELAPNEQQLAQRDKVPTQNVEAYELYLQGRAIWKRRGEENLMRAIDMYQSALARDPAFARAHAALASAYVVLPGYTKDDDDDGQKYMTMAEQSARQALALDPNIGEAHAVLAQINSDKGNLLDAESGFFFAISLEPNEPTPHHWYSILLSKVGRLDAALEQARRAYELDPTAPVLASNLGNAYLLRGDDEQALRYSRLARELGIGSGNNGVEATVAMRAQQWAEAKRLLVAQEELPAEFRPLIPPFVDAVADPAKRPPVVKFLRSVDPKVATQLDLIQPYLQLGQTDLVYNILNESLDKERMAWVHEWDLMHLWSRDARGFRQDPRFDDLVRRVGLVDYWKQYGYPDGCQAGAGDRALVCTS